MRIDEVAQRSGLSADTIRFYEKSGMLPPVARDQRGWRRFTPGDLEWLLVLERLRSTGMPLAAVKRFAASANGPEADTRPEAAMRLKLLQDHAGELAKMRAKLEACEAYLMQKISTYQTYLKDDDA